MEVPSRQGERSAADRPVLQGCGFRLHGPAAEARFSCGCKNSSGAKNNDLPSGRLSQTTVTENLQRLRERPHDSAEFPLSIIALECVFSKQPLGDGFREGKTPSD